MPLWFNLLPMKSALCFFLLAISAHATEPAWGNLSFGMSREAVRTACPNTMPSGQQLVLDAGNIADVPFAAYLTFSKDALTEIRLDCIDPRITDEKAGDVMAFYREKYGAPTRESREAFINLVWQRPGSAINLIWAPISDYSPSLLRIFYRPPDATAAKTP